MSAAVQTLDISPVGRVEGDLDVRVDIQDGVVVNAWTQAELFRGFEVILRDKDPQAGLVVTPRACGICGASHLDVRRLGARHGLGHDRAAQRDPRAQPRADRRKSLQSLPRHHYGLFMIDYTNKNYQKSKYYEEAVKRWAPFTGNELRARRHHLGPPGRDLCAARRAMAAFELHGAGRRDVRADADRRHARLVDPRTFPPQLDGDRSGSAARSSATSRSKAYDDFLAWLDERPEHANSDLGMYLAHERWTSASTSSARDTTSTFPGATCRTKTSTRSRRSKAATLRSS